VRDRKRRDDDGHQRRAANHPDHIRAVFLEPYMAGDAEDADVEGEVDGAEDEGGVDVVQEELLKLCFLLGFEVGGF
jgi:hypothetical protein